MARNYKLEGIEPAAVWKYFYEICQIPRESGNNEGITTYLLDFCREQGIKAIRDDYDNVIAWVDATPGYEEASPVILQSHSDMVCIKESGSDHNFETDPIKAYAEGDIITAEGTTLGGDDGIGMAFMMALMADKEAPHPALECVFTADEETDMRGGVNLDYSIFKGKYYLNVDGFDFAVGSAGEIDFRTFVPRKSEPVRDAYMTATINVSGLIGGHGGNQALKERANAIILLNRVLLEIEKITPYQLITIKGGREGGSMATAISVDAEAVIAIPEEKYDAVFSAVEEEGGKLAKEYEKRDPDILIEMKPVEGYANAFDGAAASKVIDLLTLMPDGLRSTNQYFRNTMGSTSNVGVLETRDDVVEIAVTMRSTDRKRYYLLEQAKRLCRLLGLEVKMICDLPAWEYSISDEWMEMIKKIYPEQEPYLLGGTGEIGYFTTNIKGLNAVSLTPNAFNCHSVNEYLSISECQYYYERMLELLRQMKHMK